MSWNNNNYQQPQGGYNNAPPQQGNWGAPPPQQNYGAPPPQPPYGQQAPQAPYGAPPQQQGQWGQGPGQFQHDQTQYGYGAPPPVNNQYGAPPPQQQYNAPPPQQQFGAPPQQQYGVPPPQQQPPYGAPPAQLGAPPVQSQGGPRFLGVPIPAPPPAIPVSQLQGYNPQFDAERIRKATKGFGTDEKTIIDTLAPLDPFQIDVLARNYEQTTGRSLQKTLEKELSSWLEYTLVLKALGPLGGDIYLLERACKGAGTHEDLLSEVLLGRSNEEIFLLKEGFRRVYNKDLVKTVQGELSMKTERMFNMALSGQRDENPYVDQQRVQQDVEALYRAGQGKIGTDEIGVCGILLSRSDAHLHAIAQAFPQRHKKSLSQMVEGEFSGHMKSGLLYLVKAYENDGQGIARDVEYLEDAMSGMGTKDERLIYRLLRCHWNRPKFASIKSQYQTRYRTTLRKRVEGETTGKYEKALVAIIEQS